ncbi:serine/arginine repetitive matrix protein 1 isoform X2 [Periplaneta americana]|uniref:serine/arginine repetitive matrix protein 1 isoform X2 n=1 Tax=Periplaneta americana TaxID=6978 RepID=UPI0037E9B779
MMSESDLKNMKFSELKSLASKRNISRRWTSKREIIDRLMNTEQEENLDMITVTLIDNSDISKDSSESEVEVLSIPSHHSEKQTRSRSRSVRRRFPKPRMTMFQEAGEVESPVQEAELTIPKQQAKKKYFPTPMKRRSKINESLGNMSINRSSKVISSKKKSLFQPSSSPDATVNKMYPEVQEQRRPITRSQKQAYFLSPDIAVKGDVRISDGTVENKDPRLEVRDEDVRKDKSFSIAEGTVTQDEEIHDVSNVRGEASPKSNFNETFEIKDDATTDASSPEVTSEKQSLTHKYSFVVKEENAKIIIHGTEEGTSTSEDDNDNKENGISHNKTMNETFELPGEDKAVIAMEVQKEENPERKKLSSPSVTSTVKSIKSPDFPHPPRKGTPAKATRIPVPKYTKKIPDFTAIHKKEFEKMESVVDSHNRKLERAKTLFSPKMTKTVAGGVPVMVFTAQPSAVKQMPPRNPVRERNVILGNQVNRKTPGTTTVRKILRSPVFTHTQTQKKDFKEIVKNKLPLQKTRTGAREDARIAIRGVRLNKRFELQMAHRRLN